MSLDTYSNLKTAIANHLDRDDLTNYIDDFIDIAEANHRRDLRIKEMITREAITINARQVSLPADFLETITLRILTTPVTVLRSVNLHEMNRQRAETTGKPTLFTVNNEFEFDKSPDSSYSGEIIYWEAQQPLSDSVTTNDVLTTHPDIYLYGALMASAPFLMDDPRLVVWKALYDNGVERANETTRRSRSAGPMTSRVSGPTP